MWSLASLSPEEIMQIRAKQLGLESHVQLINPEGEFINFNDVAPAINDIARARGEYDGIIIETRGELRIDSWGLHVSTDFEQLALTLNQQSLLAKCFDRDCTRANNYTLLRRPRFHQGYERAIDLADKDFPGFSEYEMELSALSLLPPFACRIKFKEIRDYGSNTCEVVRGYTFNGIEL